MAAGRSVASYHAQPDVHAARHGTETLGTSTTPPWWKATQRFSVSLLPLEMYPGSPCEDNRCAENCGAARSLLAERFHSG